MQVVGPYLQTEILIRVYISTSNILGDQSFIVVRKFVEHSDGTDLVFSGQTKCVFLPAEL